MILDSSSKLASSRRLVSQASLSPVLLRRFFGAEPQLTDRLEEATSKLLYFTIIPSRL